MKLRAVTLSTISLLLTAGLSNAHPVDAEARKPLVELYTSQACALCPKANERFTEFAETHDVVALTFPVGYWDYLGWKDTFAQPAFGTRQKTYNEVMGRRGPYTPQVIFHGAEHCPATKEKAMSTMADKAREETVRLDIAVHYDGEEAIFSKPMTSETDVWIAEFIPGETYTTPKKGANQGVEMVYFNRVVGISHALVEPGATHVKAPCLTSCVVILQEKGLGEVLGAGEYQADAPHHPTSG